MVEPSLIKKKTTKFLSPLPAPNKTFARSTTRNLHPNYEFRELDRETREAKEKIR